METSGGMSATYLNSRRIAKISRGAFLLSVGGLPGFLLVRRAAPCAPFGGCIRRAEDCPPYLVFCRPRDRLNAIRRGEFANNRLAALLLRAPLLANGSGRLRLRARGLKAENGFAFLHQIEPIASDRFQIAHVRLEQIDFARLSRQQDLLLIDLLLKVVDLRAALHQFLIRRHEHAYDDKPDGDDQQDEENPVKSLPDCGFTTRAEIRVTVLHFSGV